MRKFSANGSTRSLTDTDLANFISVTGILEASFVDAEHGGAMGGRPVPAALTYSIIEGFILQTMIQGTGMALPEVATKVLAPVRVGDSIWATVEVTGLATNVQERPPELFGRATALHLAAKSPIGSRQPYSLAPKVMP